MFDLDPKTYDVPLSLKTYIPDDWKNPSVMHGENRIASGLEIHEDYFGSYILYDVTPEKGQLIISESL